MTLDLAFELGAHTSVADPQMVARALGEGMRRLDRTAILDLAGSLGVRKVVMGYVGHDKHHAMTITIQQINLQPGIGDARIANTFNWNWRAVAFTDQDPPFAAFHALLPQVVKNFGAAPAKPRPSAVARRPGTFDLSISPIDLVTAGKSKLSAAASISFLAALASPHAELARERLFERAFILSTRFEQRDRLAPFLQAYALMNLEHRPAALARIGDSLRPESVALRAALNGNLPDAEAALETVADPLLRTLLGFTVQDMRHAYNRASSPADGNAGALSGDVQNEWGLLIGSRFNDEDPWTVDSPQSLKILLDLVFPAPGLDLRSVTEGGAIIGADTAGFDPVNLDFIIARHIRLLVGEFTMVACCDADRVNQVSHWDLLWLLESRAEGGLIKELYRLDSMQGSPKEAMGLLDRYEPIFAGHPALAAARARAAMALARTAPSDLRLSWQNRMRQSGLLATYWSPGENRTAYIGLRTMEIPGSETSLLEDAYGFDFPRRSYWPPLFYMGGERDPANTWLDFAKESLEYSRVDLDPIQNLARCTEEDKRRIYADLQSRFIGAPQRIVALASLRPQSDTPSGKREELRAAIKAEPDTWSNFYNLAQFLISTDGNYEEAHKVLLSYQRFQSAADPLNAVQLSNEAYESGSLFYLHGHTDLSKDLYKIASDLHTGSAGGITSDVRLHLLAGELRAAMTGSFERATRYPSSYAYRDYLSLLHATGNNVQAWLGFSQVASAFDIPQVWVSALVGHRLEGRSERYVQEWLHRPEIRNARFGTHQFAPAVAILWSSTDRMPPPDLDRLVESLEDKPSVPDERMAGAPTKSALSYFAAAYSALRHSRWTKSAETFRQMAEHYAIDAGEDSFALPYFAMAAIKTGDKR